MGRFVKRPYEYIGDKTLFFRRENWVTASFAPPLLRRQEPLPDDFWLL
jgi:hypothetical protein